VQFVDLWRPMLLSSMHVPAAEQREPTQKCWLR
jgi:hypothetical protein